MASSILKLFFTYNNVCLILNDDSGSELCTDKDYGFEGDDGVDLITWTLPAESVTKGTGIFSYHLKYKRGFSHTPPCEIEAASKIRKNINFKVILDFQNPDYPAQITDFKIYYKDCSEFIAISDVTIG